MYVCVINCRTTLVIPQIAFKAIARIVIVTVVFFENCDVKFEDMVIV